MYNSFTAMTEEELLFSFPKNYIVLDCETSGSAADGDITEIGLARVRDGVVTQTYSSLIRTRTPVTENSLFVSHITNDMLANAPTPKEVFSDVLRFIGDDIIVGHHVKYDLRYLEESLFRYLSRSILNQSIDTLDIAKRLHPEFDGKGAYGLGALVERFSLPQYPAHRALNDCLSTMELYEHFAKTYDPDRVCVSPPASSTPAPAEQKYGTSIDIHMTPTVQEINADNPFYHSVCVFTGNLAHLSRSDAAQMVVNLGGDVRNGITLKTTCLIIGDDESPMTVGGKSGKYRKAEEHIANGQDIRIMSEAEFYDILRTYLGWSDGI